MYSKNELLKFSVLNTYEDRVNPNLIYKIFEKSSERDINIFNFSKVDLKYFLEDSCKFNEIQINKVLDLFQNFLDDEIYSLKDECEKKGIKILFLNYKNYPKNLAKIKRAPYVLYLKGTLNLEFYSTVALVGTRNLSSTGKIFTEKIAEKLKENNYFNISGLANGIDTVGHINTLGNTGAVLAYGLGMETYPRNNKLLADKILENNGFLISEFPPRTNIFANNFIRRNRIQSGLADDIIIAETGIKGGTVHTFKYAKQQHKKIFVADFNKEFIEKFRKDIIIIKDFKDFLEKSENLLNQQKLF